MSWGYDRRLDRMTGHDFPGVVGNGMDDFTRDELELGARAALQLGEGNDEQTYWELVALKCREEPSEDCREFL